MVRVGGGWYDITVNTNVLDLLHIFVCSTSIEKTQNRDTLEHYLIRHDPCRRGHDHSRSPTPECGGRPRLSNGTISPVGPSLMTSSTPCLSHEVLSLAFKPLLHYFIYSFFSVFRHGFQGKRQDAGKNDDRYGDTNVVVDERRQQWSQEIRRSKSHNGSESANQHSF